MSIFNNAIMEHRHAGQCRSTLELIMNEAYPQSLLPSSGMQSYYLCPTKYNRVM